METMKVKPWGEGQGEFVIIDKDDYDPKKHEIHGEGAIEGAPGKAVQIDGQGLPPVADGLTMAHKGRGRYDVTDAAGNVVATGVSKDQAQAAIDAAKDE